MPTEYNSIEAASNSSTKRRLGVAGPPLRLSGRAIEEQPIGDDERYAANARFSLALQAAGVGVWEWSFQTNTLLWSDKMYEIYGIPPGTPITSERWKSAVHPDDLQLASGIFSPSTQQTDHEKRRFRIVHPERGVRFIEAAQELLLDAEGAPIAWVGADRDVTEWRYEQEELQTRAAELERLSMTDPLTGVGNRRRLEIALDSEIARAQRYGGSLSLLHVDLDHFKQVNDTFGHEVGDLFLYQTAQVIQQSVRETEIVSRFGGDEFCILAPQITSEQAINLADRIKNRLMREKIYPLDHPLTASFGVVHWRDGESASSLMQRADQLMYQAKSEGRNRICSDGPTKKLLRLCAPGAAAALPHALLAEVMRPASVFSFRPHESLNASPFLGVDCETLALLRAEAQQAAAPPPFN